VLAFHTVITLATGIFNVEMFYFHAILLFVVSSDGLNVTNGFGLSENALLIAIYQTVMLVFCISWYKL
jgi:hypothetical protein